MPLDISECPRGIFGLLLTPARMLQGNFWAFLQAHWFPFRSGGHCQGCLPSGILISYRFNFFSPSPYFCLLLLLWVLLKKLAPQSPAIITEVCLGTWPIPILPNSVTEETTAVNTALLYIMMNLFWYESMFCLSVLNEAWINIWKYSPSTLPLKFCHL